MSFERNNRALQFETMLRRHLKSGGAPVAACAGFDFDAASAYLENALGGSQRAGYESHLAGCATCRRHLIELSRLGQISPREEMQPATVAVQIPVWSRWREIAAGWFDLSGWNKKWQIVGAAGAVFAILIAALGVQSLRRPASDNSIAASKASSIAAQSTAGEISPTPESSVQAEQQALADSNLIAGRQDQPREAEDRARVPVPTPQVKLINGSPEVAVAPSTRSLSQSISSQTSDALPPSTPNAPVGGRAGVEVGPKRKDARQGELAGMGQSRIGPPAGTDPLNTKPQEPGPRLQIQASGEGPKSSGNSDLAKTEQRRKTQPDIILPKSVRKAVRLLVPLSDSNSKSESEQKAKIEDQDDEAPKLLKRGINGKVFIFHRDSNMWIDKDYKPERDEWRLLRLAVGSEDYKKVLANEPQLKEFFDFAPVIVIWNNKIYKVKAQ